MRIDRIRVLKHFIRLPQPLSISFHTFTFSEIYYLTLETNDGIIGWGEGAPFQPITGDSIEEVRAELPLLARLLGQPLQSVSDGIVAAREGMRSSSLKAALDFALHDLFAKRQGMPTHRLLCSSPRIIPNCVTVFLKDSVEETRLETQRLLQLFPHLALIKIKLKGTDDIARCRAIREIAPSRCAFVLDANQGFHSPEDAVRDLTAIIDTLGHVVLIEEPCPKGDLDKAAFVTKRVKGARIVADESCCGTSDLMEIVRTRAFHGINIKLQKAGGILPALDLARTARQHDLAVMVGQMFESPLSTAASLALAVSQPNVLLTDLDMDLELPTFSSGIATFEGGARYPVSGPGFGFSLIDSEVEELCRAGKIEREVWADFSM